MLIDPQPVKVVDGIVVFLSAAQSEACRCSFRGSADFSGHDATENAAYVVLSLDPVSITLAALSHDELATPTGLQLCSGSWFVRNFYEHAVTSLILDSILRPQPFLILASFICCALATILPRERCSDLS